MLASQVWPLFGDMLKDRVISNDNLLKQLATRFWMAWAAQGVYNSCVFTDVEA